MPPTSSKYTEGGPYPEQQGVTDPSVCKGVSGGGLRPTWSRGVGIRYKSAKIRKALDEVEDGEVFLFTDVDVQYFQPVKGIVEERMASGVDMIFQKELLGASEEIIYHCKTKQRAIAAQ